MAKVYFTLRTIPDPSSSLFLVALARPYRGLSHSPQSQQPLWRSRKVERKKDLISDPGRPRTQSHTATWAQTATNTSATTPRTMNDGKPPMAARLRSCRHHPSNFLYARCSPLLQSQCNWISCLCHCQVRRLYGTEAHAGCLVWKPKQGC